MEHLIIFIQSTKYMLGTKYLHNCSKLVFSAYAISSAIHLVLLRQV